MSSIDNGHESSYCYLSYRSNKLEFFQHPHKSHDSQLKLGFIQVRKTLLAVPFSLRTIAMAKDEVAC